MTKKLAILVVFVVAGLALLQAAGLASPLYEGLVQALANHQLALEKSIACHTLVRGNPFRNEVALDV